MRTTKSFTSFLNKSLKSDEFSYIMQGHWITFHHSHKYIEKNTRIPWLKQKVSTDTVRVAWLKVQLAKTNQQSVFYKTGVFSEWLDPQKNPNIATPPTLDTTIPLRQYQHWYINPKLEGCQNRSSILIFKANRSCSSSYSTRKYWKVLTLPKSSKRRTQNALYPWM